MGLALFRASGSWEHSATSGAVLLACVGDVVLVVEFRMEPGPAHCRQAWQIGASSTTIKVSASPTAAAGWGH
jgi:hypothetical protein